MASFGKILLNTNGFIKYSWIFFILHLKPPQNKKPQPLQKISKKRNKKAII